MKTMFLCLLPGNADSLSSAAVAAVASIHSPYCPTCGCPSPMASPTHTPSSSAPPSPSSLSASVADESPAANDTANNATVTATETTPASHHRSRRSKRYRLSSIDEVEVNNNSVSSPERNNENVDDNSRAVMTNSANTNLMSCGTGDDDLVASHLRHMQTREQLDEFRGQLPVSYGYRLSRNRLRLRNRRLCD